MAELNVFKESVTPYVQEDFTAKSGELGETVQSLLIESIELTTAQKDTLNKWWLEPYNEGESLTNWVDLLMWVIKKIIEWIKGLFD